MAKVCRTFIICTLLPLLMIISGCDGSGGGNSILSSYSRTTISGKVQYEDREYGRSGFTGNTEFKSVRYAEVDLVDYEGNVVATTTTDEQGDYTVTGAGKGLYVRVIAMTSREAGTVLEISNYSGSIYAVRKNLDLIDENDQLNFNIDFESGVAGAFNILDVYTNASLFISSISTRTLPVLKTYWQAASSRYGTYFCPWNSSGGSCPRGKGVYLLGGSSSGGDTDEYDDDVLYHEYGHYLESSLGIMDSPGGRHYLTDNDSDLRLAWSEGFGGFFPGAVKKWLAENDPQRLSTQSDLPAGYFVDTYGTLAAISIDMADPSRMFCLWGVDCFVYSSSEVAVAKILNEFNESFGMHALWSVISGYMPSGTRLPATLETFWDGWLQQRNPGVDELGSALEILNDRLVYYQEDDYEGDGQHNINRKLTACTGNSCAGEVHNLYKNGTPADVDLIAFDAQAGQSYEIETVELSNGADTFLQIIDEVGNVVVDSFGQTMSNNDRPGTVYCYNFDNPCRIHNDDTMLSSSLSFTPLESKTYFIEVKTYSSKSAAAGRYGTYTLRVTEQ